MWEQFLYGLATAVISGLLSGMLVVTVFIRGLVWFFQIYDNGEDDNEDNTNGPDSMQDRCKPA